MKRQYILLLFLYCISILIFLPKANAETLDIQRKNYLKAQQSLKNKQYTTFNRLANSLKNYPLYPYLRYEYLRKNLWKIKNNEMIEFFANYDDLPVANSLRNSWLKLLAKRKNWRTFINNYSPKNSATPLIKCYYLQAKMNSAYDSSLLNDITNVWLSDKSLPKECDVAFTLLQKHNLMNDELIWKRLRLAMQSKELGLAGYLSKKLSSNNKKLAIAWINAHKNPARQIKNPILKNNEKGREILLYGIERLARKNIKSAVYNFNTLKTIYSFSKNDIENLKRKLAIRAAKKKSSLAIGLLDEINNDFVDDEVFHYRLKLALQKQDWLLLRHWTQNQGSISEKSQLRFSYWQARALEKTKAKQQAINIYKEIAKERDYYGFLAADRLNISYEMNNYPILDDKKERAYIKSLPAIQRSYELYKLKTGYIARREWHHAINKMNTHQINMAAIIAFQWGWHDRVILTMGKAKATDDLIMRFPILFSKLFNKYAKKRKLDSSWVFGLSRAESAFMESVRSPAGALGLMQVMPKTGKMTAKKIGMKNFKTYKLKQAAINIPIGTAYLSQMLNKFNNMVLATASYNAGPHRVSKWLPSECMPADIWIEKIPFKETRKYVSRVLFYSVIYDWRLNKKIKPLKERMKLSECVPQKIT